MWKRGLKPFVSSGGVESPENKRVAGPRSVGELLLYCLQMETWVSYAGILRFGFEPLGDFMEWTAPVFEEVCLNCEINSYASAKL